MTKIVHVIPALTKGGAERVAVDLANQQLARGHDVWMVAGSKVDERLLRQELDHAIGLEYISEATSRAGRTPRQTTARTSGRGWKP